MDEKLSIKHLPAQVNVSTVDSYQGRQMDVIILSCVRSNPAARGVGFVDDMRRMNVSITRAKRALWVLGSAATLSHSPVWAALLQVLLLPNDLLMPGLPGSQCCLFTSSSCRHCSDSGFACVRFETLVDCIPLLLK